VTAIIDDNNEAHFDGNIEESGPNALHEIGPIEGIYTVKAKKAGAKPHVFVKTRFIVENDKLWELPLENLHATDALVEHMYPAYQKVCFEYGDITG
jgi:hypothetical protein